MPMFPLGSVLFPFMPLQLRVFEPRYVLMLSEMLPAGQAEFGVALIERGQEVGGGEQRFAVGTVAEITDLQAHDGMILLAARGTRRFEVTRWYDDAPYPRAEVTALPDLTWDDDVAALRDRAEQLVRRTLAVASEFSDASWPPDVELSDDPVTATWQLAGIAPISALDQVSLLRAKSATDLLHRVIDHTTEAADTFTAAWPDEDST